MQSHERGLVAGASLALVAAIALTAWSGLPQARRPGRAVVLHATSTRPVALATTAPLAAAPRPRALPARVSIDAGVTDDPRGTATLRDRVRKALLRLRALQTDRPRARAAFTLEITPR